jgi:uncharacterized protein
MCHPRSLLALPLIALCLVPDGARLHAAGFDCSKASSRVEQMICRDDEVSALDEHLARYYQAARMALGRGAECLKADQRQWLANVRGRCTDRDCLRNVYLARLAELDGLQPGATAIRDIELPEAAQMIGVLPPAEDEVAAPRTSNATPVELSGRIVDDLESGDGFVLRDGLGKSHLLRPLMFIEPEDADLLAAAARKPESTYLVRGFLQAGEESSLDVSRCAYVYRLPPAKR